MLPCSGNDDSGTHSLVEGQISGELTHILEKGTCGLYASIFHSLRSQAHLTYDNSIVKKDLLERAADESRKFWLVYVKSISDVCFGVLDLSGPSVCVLILL